MSRLRGIMLAICASACALTGAGASAARPPAERIVTLAPHLAELMFTAGAGKRIVGIVEYSDHPAEARSIPRVGDAFRVDLERLIALTPDVVLAWHSGTPRALIERIEGLGLRVETLETQRLADVATVLRTIGEIAGTEHEADAAAAAFERDIEALRRAYSGRPKLRVFVQIGEHPLYTVNGRQIMSELLELCGGENVFARLPELAPAVSIEAVIAADPEIIVVADDVTGEPLALWRKWRSIAAVRTRNVYSVEADDVSRATTRLIDGARELCRTLDTARARRTRAAH